MKIGKNKYGISMISLIITIIVIIILATIIILSLKGNDLLKQSSKAKFMNDVAVFKEDLELYKQKQYLNTSGKFNPDTLYAPVDNIDIYDVIPSLENSSYGKDDFRVEKGQLIYQGTNTDDQNWADDSGIIVDRNPVEINVVAMQGLPIKSGVDIKYSIRITSTSKIIQNDLKSNLVVVDSQGKELSTQPDISLSEYLITETTQTTVATINTKSITDGIYKLKIKAGAVNNIVKLPNAEIISPDYFEVDNIAPSDIIGYEISPKEYTNLNVTLSLIKTSADINKIYYKVENSDTFEEYTVPLLIDHNENVFVKATDIAGNEGDVQTIAITNIDNVAPSVEISNIVVDGRQIDANISLNDNIAIDNTKSKYKIVTYNYNDDNWDNANVINQNSIIISSEQDAGNYYIQVLAVDSAGNKTFNVSDAITTTPYPKTKVIVDEPNTTTTVDKNTTIDGQLPSYNNPIIPAGFFPVNTDVKWNGVSAENKDINAAWNQGLVIQDNYGNQFVWVPIDGQNVTYQKIFTFNSDYAATAVNTTDDSFPEGLNEYDIENKYQGFYIARYQASFDYNSGNIRARSMRSTNVYTSSWPRNSNYTGYLWNFVNYSDAKAYSEAFDGNGKSGYYGYNYDTSKVGTNLVTGTQWDSAMKWIQNAGYNVTTDSSGWGNYRDVSYTYTYPSTATKYYNSNMLLNTGASIHNRAKNIYDLAGNLWEWTNEIYNSNYYILRGGTYYNYRSEYQASFRGKNTINYIHSGTGFRVALYVK